MYKNKFYLVLISFIMIFTLVGCNKKADEKVTTKNETVTEKQTESETEEETKSVLPLSSSSDYESEILRILGKVTTPIDEAKIEELIALTENNDYTFQSVFDLIGNPHFILDTYDGKEFYVYDSSLAEKKLASLFEDDNYTTESFVKIGWLTSNDKIISTYIPLDLKDELMITGFLIEDIDSNDILNSEKLPSTSISLKDIDSIDISMDKLIEKLGTEPFMYKIQYPMSFESQFIQSRMDEDSANLTSRNYAIKIEKDEVTMGYLMIETFEDMITDIYEVYEDNSTLAIIDDATADKVKNSTDMTKENFLELIPGATKIEIMRSSFDNTVSAIEYYGFIRESDKEDSKVTTVQIVNNKVISEVPEEKVSQETTSSTETTTTSTEN